MRVTTATLDRSSDQEDRRLLDAVRAGDDDALAELHRRHWGVAVRVAHRILRNDDDAQEAAAEGFARILKALRAGKGPTEQFGGYLTITVRNAALAMCRRRTVPVDDVDLEQAVHDDEDPLSGGTLLMDVFLELRPRWREILWLTEVEGWTSQELAERFNASPNTMAAVAYRARAALRTAYFAAYEDDPAELDSCSSIAPLLDERRAREAPASVRYQVTVHVQSCARCREAGAAGPALVLLDPAS